MERRRRRVWAYHSSPDVLSVSKSSLTPREGKKKKVFDGSFFLPSRTAAPVSPILLILPFWNYNVLILFFFFFLSFSLAFFNFDLRRT
jgi:hypothetical protein